MDRGQLCSRFSRTVDQHVITAERELDQFLEQLSGFIDINENTHSLSLTALFAIRAGKNERSKSLQEFGAYQDASVRDPVITTKNGRPRTVLIAYEDYLRLTRRDRRVRLTSALGGDYSAAIEASEMDGSLVHLNAELLTGKACCR